MTISSIHIPRTFRSGCLLFFILFFSFPAFPKKATDTKDYILIINSYTEASTWSNELISVLTAFAGKNPQLSLYAEHMNMFLIDNDDTMDEFKQTLKDKYTEHPPRLLVLLDNPALILRETFKQMWGDIPIILCGNKDFYSQKEAYLRKQATPPAQRTPISTLAGPYNLVFLYSNLYIKENIEMMFRMIPDMNKFIFVGDERMLNQLNDDEIRKELKENHPDIRYEFLSPKDLTVNNLIDTLNTIDPATTGVLFSSWFYKRTIANESILIANSHKIIATVSAPLFTLNLVNITNGNPGMAGSYTFNQKKYYEKLLSILSGVLAGEQPRNIPFYIPSGGAPVIDYEVLLRKKISPALCPPGTLFLNKPPAFWEQYKYFIAGSLLCILLVILIFQYRIRTLRKLRETQQKEINMMAQYKSLIDNMPLVYIQIRPISDKNGKPADWIYSGVNRCFIKTILPREDIIGKRASETIPGLRPAFLPFIQMALKENKAISFPYYFKANDTYYDIILKRSYQNDLIDIFCVDSTRLHKAQKKISATNSKLAMTLDVANILPWKWDLRAQTILCDINRPVELGMLDGEINEKQLAVPDSQYFSKIYKEDRKRVEQAYKDLLEGRSDKVKEEYRVVYIRNHTRKIEWVEAQAAIESRDGEGKPLTLVGSLLIITDRKKMEMELTVAKDRAEESNRLKSAFLANMSHEIRTPLNAIVGFSGILASTEEEREKQEYVNIIENNNTLLLQLINDILDLSKIEAGTLEFQYSNVELNTLLKELEGAMQLKINPDAVRLEFIPSLEKCPVYTEKNRLLQLFINLLTNAIKFTREGSIRFGYEVRNRELYCYVTDTGCGIPEDKQTSIFDRFVKLDTFAQGTGLGLSICQTLVEHMKGRIGLNSKEGEGSTFWFTLPYEAPRYEEALPKTVFQPLRVEKDKLTILIAEDNDSNYKLFESILKNDYRLLHAWNGREAVELFRTHNPQIILMDINMPVMDGYRATKEIRKYSVKVPIIAITAFAYASDEQRVMESGFDGYMPKPINALLLKTQIQTIMKQRIILL